MTPWTAARQASLSLTISQSLLKFMSIELVMPSNHLVPCRSLLLLPSIFSSIRVFSNELALRIRWPKYWSFNFSISPSNEYSRLIFFRIDWLEFLPVQGILKNRLQHHSSKASILQCSIFFYGLTLTSIHDYFSAQSSFMVWLSHPYMTTGKTIALTIWTLLTKWCLCFLIQCLGLS